jgi:hypothetical protein
MAFKKLAKKNGDYPARWLKEEQPTIEGTVIDFRKDIMGKPGSDAITVENADGKFTVWLDKVLHDYAEYFVLGATVRITFLGKQKSKNGINSFNNYEVEVDDVVSDK